MIAKVFSFPKLISVLCCDCWFTNCGQFRKASKNRRKNRRKNQRKSGKKVFLVRLEFELKLEPLLLYSPAPATAAAATPTPTPPLC